MIKEDRIDGETRRMDAVDDKINKCPKGECLLCFYVAIVTTRECIMRMRTMQSKFDILFRFIYGKSERKKGSGRGRRI